MKTLLLLIILASFTSVLAAPPQAYDIAPGPAGNRIVSAGEAVIQISNALITLSDIFDKDEIERINRCEQKLSFRTSYCSIAESRARFHGKEREMFYCNSDFSPNIGALCEGILADKEERMELAARREAVKQQKEQSELAAKYYIEGACYDNGFETAGICQHPDEVSEQ